MDNQQKKEWLRKTNLFSGVNDQILQQIAEHSHYKKLQQNEVLIEENAIAESVYIIVTGSFSVYKSVADAEDAHADFTILKSGDTIGEIAFLDEHPRSANVKALEDNCAVLEIQNTDLQKLAPISFYKKLATRLSSNIRNSNEKIVEQLRNQLRYTKKMANMGSFITYILLLISFYHLALYGFVALADNPYTSMFASTSVIFIFTIFMGMLARKMGYPLKKCGVNLHEWKPALVESLVATLLFIILLTLIKWCIIHFIPAYANSPLFYPEANVQIFAKDSLQFYLWLLAGMIVYALFAIFQEFIARGVLQTSLQDFLQNRHKDLLANVVTSGIFASTHIHLSSRLALVVFIPSLLWGWLYIRHPTLLGPVVSHVLIGWWAIFFLGIEGFLG